MSMHLVGPHITTTQYYRKNKNKKNKRLQALTQEHEDWLKSQGLDNASLKRKLPHDPKGRRQGIYSLPDLKTESRVTSDAIPQNGNAKKVNIYTGNELLGIATMHKSNAVPIRKDNPQAAIDIANMRR